MRIAIPVQDNLGLESHVAFRFARAPFFAIYDTETKKVEIISNPYSVQGRGVGPAVVQLLADMGVNKLLAPSIGPNAQSALNMLGIDVQIVQPGISIRQALASIGLSV